MESKDIFHSLFEYVAQNPQPAARKNEAPVTKETPPSEIARRFLRQFGIRELSTALRDGKTPLSLKWYVQELLSLLRDNKTTSPTKLDVLRELKNLVAMGAIQEPDVIRELNGPKRKKKSASQQAENDIFLKLHKAKRTG